MNELVTMLEDAANQLTEIRSTLSVILQSAQDTKQRDYYHLTGDQINALGLIESCIINTERDLSEGIDQHYQNKRAQVDAI